jgi:nitrite reductase/ring-hydroxylating ferredoxin subunit
VHGGKLDVRDGSPQRHPIRRSATTYRVREQAGRIEIELSAQPQETLPCTTS